MAKSGDKETGEYKTEMIKLADANLTFIGNVSQDVDGQSVFLVTTDLTSITDCKDESSPKQIHFDESGCVYMLEMTEAVASDSPQTSQRKKNNTNRDASDVSQSWFTSRTDKDYMSGKGVHWRRGLWQKDEQVMLENNINKYCERIGVSDPSLIIFNMTKEERKNFYRTISKGLKRPLFSVYRRVIRNYDPKNYIGKYSPDDMNTLQKLHEEYGNDWVTIGASLGRSASSVKDKCRLMKVNNGGKWLLNEESLLSEAVQLQTNAKLNDGANNSICWPNIAKHVATRTAKQCRTKWLNYLSWKVKGGTEWTRDDDISLILKLCNMGNICEHDIDWNTLATDWSSVRSPQWLKCKWWTLKRHVPDYQDISLNEILAHLKWTHIENASVPHTVSHAPPQLTHGQHHSAVLPVDGARTDVTNCILPVSYATTDVLTQGDESPEQSVSLHITRNTLPHPNVTATKCHDTITVQIDPLADFVLPQEGQDPLTNDPIACDTITPLTPDLKAVADGMDLTCDERRLGHPTPHIVMMTTTNSQFTNTCTVLMSDPMMVSNSNDLSEDKQQTSNDDL